MESMDVINLFKADSTKKDTNLRFKFSSKWLSIASQNHSQCDSQMVFVNPERPNPGQRKKIKLNFYFHTSSWCLKRYYEGLKGLHKTF